jgi:hypothetical protein
MMTEMERAKILEMIEDGSITAEEGLRLLEVIDGAASELVADLEVEPQPAWTEPSPMPDPDVDTEEVEYYEEVKILDNEPAPSPPDPEDLERWKRWWFIPLWVGIGITVIGGLLMFWAYSAGGFGFWFACSWFPFLLGVGVLALAWGSHTAPWLHVRVQQAPGETPQRIAISFPIPVHLTVWGLRLFGHYIPHMEGVPLDEVILALKEVSKDGTPFFVDVDEGENGEKVQVFIG